MKNRIRDRYAFRFGDKVLSIHASADNPRHHGTFVRIVVHRGRMNPGRFAECTDECGDFWKVPIEDLRFR